MMIIFYLNDSFIARMKSNIKIVSEFVLYTLL